MMTGNQTEDPAKLKAEAIALAAALHTVLNETREGEIARIALSGLNETETGRNYLEANPIRY